MFATANLSLENLRDNMETRLNIDLICAELQALTHQIHAGFLFMDEGEETLQIICAWVGAAEVGLPYSNWKDFANHLSISRVKIQNIQNHFQGKNGPVWWVLASYAQWDDATIGTVINALRLMQREDIINKINHSVRELVRHINGNVSLNDNRAEIFKPPNVPWVPLELRPPSSNISKTFKIINITLMIGNLPEQSNREITANNRGIVPFALRVMLTFAWDGTEAANRITEVLRSHKSRIGVLIFNEQEQYVFATGYEFVDDCIEQVDAIIPILTPGYIDEINNRPTVEAKSSFGRDQEYVKYIFEYLREEFIYNNCTNERVGCIVPKNTKFTRRNLSPVLRAWYSEEHLENLIELLLSEKLRKLRSQ